MNDNICIKNVTVSFTAKAGIVQAVNHIDAIFNSGEITGIIGETGSGKSVLGLSVLRLLAENSRVTGNIIYQDRDILQLPAQELNQLRGKTIAFIPQNTDTAFNPVMTVGRQIGEGAAYHHNIPQAAARRQAIEQLRRYAFQEPQTVAARYPFQLSGGMRQRALCAMSTALSPKWLIADEPTKGLDAIIRRQVFQLFHDLKASAGISVMLITHDLRLAEKLCDAIFVLYAGTVLEQGTAGEIFAGPLHPYTRGLINAQPHKTLTPLPGMPPSLIDLPAGCKFQPRCSCRKSICRLQEPPLQAINGRRQVRCWQYA
ncbi:ABC transporter ATP-binding protein [Sporomusa acidovorans]|uniref:Nickel import system ATP-binding protein NikD n=1 Tax=Sporomusa acidovorans (strain ATCC 49682 / DSM 3132 / Mol) TaxID=1123286 RepID=A0ABZ3J4L8_SPOA4|nr:ABC transporter ATP-binding protein [Sporomusa acidovorans]OZC23948.1 oligopeptide transport ATP-binding protein OppD [Sporomusa acidovorans DSM 3132]SDF31884.1 peptide/nickel transport system ATP-binding protein [Sporomusa acidovorans]